MNFRGNWRLVPNLCGIVTGKPAWFDTRVAILWDDECLYFGFSAEETNVCATLTQRDSKIYEDNDLEVFIAGEDAYYEFEINALNTVYEVFWIWKDIFRPGQQYFGRPEFNPAAHPTLEISGIGGPRASARRALGISRLGFSGLAPRRARRGRHQ